MVEGFRRLDPPSVPQLAVPIRVPKQCLKAARTTHDKMVAHLTTAAFFYLLRIGEYTFPRTKAAQKQRKRTVNFRVKDVGFWKNGKILPRNSSLATLQTADSATLKITNQKNGRMGQTIHQEATNDTACPVHSLAWIVHHILSNNGGDANYICDFYTGTTWSHITDQDIKQAIRTAAKTLNLRDQGIDPDLLGTHSLRAGGAMALKLQGFADTIIMKLGRWTSLTFLQYIHNQIAHLSAGVSKKMSEDIAFLNIAAIE